MQEKPCQTQIHKVNTEAQNIVIGKAKERSWPAANTGGEPAEGALLQRTHTLKFRDATIFHVGQRRNVPPASCAKEAALFCILMVDKY